MAGVMGLACLVALVGLPRASRAPPASRASDHAPSGTAEPA
jgi:hypothetical protein